MTIAPVSLQQALSNAIHSNPQLTKASRLKADQSNNSEKMNAKVDQFILQVEYNHSQLAQQFTVKIKPVLQLKEGQISAITGNSLTFRSNTPMVPGTLLAVSPSQNGDRFFVSAAHLMRIESQVQMELYQFLMPMLDQQSETEVAPLFKPIMSAVQAILKTLPATSQVIELSQALSMQTKSLPPIQWLSEQSMAHNQTLPEWIKALPQMAQKVLQEQNLQLLHSILRQSSGLAPNEQQSADASSHLYREQAATYQPETRLAQKQSPTLDIPIMFKVPPLTSKSMDKAVNTYLEAALKMELTSLNVTPIPVNIAQSQREVEIWLTLQQRWLAAPESLLNNLTNTLELLKLHEGSSLRFLNQELLKISPSYYQATAILLEMANKLLANESLSVDDITVFLKKIMLETAQNEIDHKSRTNQTEILKALALKVGLSEFIANNLTQLDSSSNDKQNLQFDLPYTNQFQDSTSWFKASLSHERTEMSKTRPSGQILTLDFESISLGFVRFAFTFSEGFTVLKSTAEVWLEQTRHLPHFQKFENQLYKNLAKAGLELHHLHWRLGLPDDKILLSNKKPRFQIDDYV